MLVPGGAFRPGLSPHEEALLDGWLEGDCAGQDREALAWCLEEIRQECAQRDEVEVGPLLMARDPSQRELPWSLCSALRDPTDAEWEWAVRAGTQTLFWWGDEPPRRIDEPEQLPDGHPLGLRAIGWEFEQCVGEDHPDDGKRWARGGAGESAPWQNTGELTSVLSAYRARYAAAGPVYRPVLPLEALV